MGACATKPKADATDAPAPFPEKDEVVKNELTVAADADADNSRSLSTLLKESEQVKGSAENEKTQPELVKEEACKAEKDTGISETKTTEVAEPEILVETASVPTVDAAAVEVETEEAIEVEAPISIVDVPAKVETEESAPTICAVAENESEKEIEVASATDVQKTESVKEKKIEKHEKAIETPIYESIDVDSAGGKTQVVEEKASVPVEVEADQKIDVASAIEIQKAEAVEETKIEEEKAVTEEKTTESEVCAENVKP